MIILENLNEEYYKNLFNKCITLSEIDEIYNKEYNELRNKDDNGAKVLLMESYQEALENLNSIIETKEEEKMGISNIFITILLFTLLIMIGYVIIK